MDNRIEFIDISNLRFDPENPRIPTTLRGKADKKIIDWMLLDASLLDLMNSIIQNGFFQGEPILVVPRRKGYTVVEGNRRLGACLVLNNPTLSKTKQKSVQEIINGENKTNIPTKLPAVVFSDRENVLDYLGYRHITGVKSWNPLAKARYLEILYSKLKMKGRLDDKCKKLAKKIGSKADHVKQLLVGYWLFEILENEGFYKIKGLDEESIEFSHLYDSLRFLAIRKFLNVDFDIARPTGELNRIHFEEFCRWTFERTEGQTRLGGGGNLKVLNKIVEKREALKAFRSGKSLAEASSYSDYPEELFSNHVLKTQGTMQEALRISVKIENCTGRDLSDLKEIRESAITLIKRFELQ